MLKPGDVVTTTNDGYALMTINPGSLTQRNTSTGQLTSGDRALVIAVLTSDQLRKRDDIFCDRDDDDDEALVLLGERLGWCYAFSLVKVNL